MDVVAKNRAKGLERISGILVYSVGGECTVAASFVTRPMSSSRVRRMRFRSPAMMQSSRTCKMVGSRGKPGSAERTCASRVARKSCVPGCIYVTSVVCATVVVKLHWPSLMVTEAWQSLTGGVDLVKVSTESMLARQGRQCAP